VRPQLEKDKMQSLDSLLRSPAENFAAEIESKITEEKDKMPRKKLNLVAPVEEFGERWHAELPRGQITWLPVSRQRTAVDHRARYIQALGRLAACDAVSGRAIRRARAARERRSIFGRRARRPLVEEKDKMQDDNFTALAGMRRDRLKLYRVGKSGIYGPNQAIATCGRTTAPCYGGRTPTSNGGCCSTWPALTTACGGRC
jgi:hypothetical protein